MAITTVDGIIAGMEPPMHFHKVLSGTLVAGRPFSSWSLAGIPGAGSFNGTLNGATVSSADAGTLPLVNPVSGNSYLNRFIGNSSAQAGSLLLCDRLWHNGGYTITSTSAQAITSPTWPARDIDGSTNGNGVFLGVEVATATGAGTPTLTVSYTNSAGTASRSATNIDATVASSIAATFYRIGLQAGDVGVRSVQSLTLSATWTSGTIALVAYRPIAMVSINSPELAGFVDTLSGGFQRIYDSSSMFFIFVPSTTTTTRIHGMVQLTQG